MLDETWTIYNDEQLAELSGLTADMFSDEKYKEMMENSNSFTDFFAQHSSGASINVMFENLGLLYGSVMSEEQYRTAALQNLSGAYESAGFENVGTYMIVGFVGLNFLVELLINVVLSPIIVKLIGLGKKNA